MLSADCTEARRFRKPTFIGFKSGVGCTTYLTSKLSQESRLISQALTSKSLWAWTIGVVYTPQTERVIVLSKILALNKSLALLLSVLLAASVGTITIGQYRRIGCYDYFVKSQGCFFTCARPILEYDVLLKCFFIFLPTIKDVVGYYKFRNDMRQCLHPIANDVEENPGPTIFNIIDPTSTDSSFFQLSATGYLAFLTLGYFGQPAPLSSVVYI